MEFRCCPFMGLWHEVLKYTASTLTAALAILFGKFGAQKLWSHHNKPKLRFIDSDAIEGIMRINRDVIILRYYRVVIENSGKSPAKNCKPQVKLIGNFTSNGKRYKIKIEGALCWSELGNPSRITLNPGKQRL